MSNLPDFLCLLLSEFTGFHLVSLCSSGWAENASKKSSDLSEVLDYGCLEVGELGTT